MNRSRSACLSLALAASVFLSACATSYSPTAFWEVKESALMALKAGVTTKDEVLKQVGKPEFTASFPNIGVEVWDYRYLEGKTRRMIAYVYFDTRGVFKHVTSDLDPAYSNADGASN